MDAETNPDIIVYREALFLKNPSNSDLTRIFYEISGLTLAVSGLSAYNLHALWSIEHGYRIHNA